MRYGHIRHIVMFEMRDDTDHVIREERAANAAFFPVRSHHEVIDDQLAAAVEQIGEGLTALRRIEHVGLIDLHPRQRAAFARKLVAGAHVRFLFG